MMDKSICLGKPKHDDCAIIDLRLNQVGRRYFYQTVYLGWGAVGKLYEDWKVDWN